MHCSKCGNEIPAERLEVLPNTTTCVACSSAKKVVGFTISNFSKGTASELCLVNQDDSESMRLAIRANRRAR